MLYTGLGGKLLPSRLPRLRFAPGIVYASSTAVGGGTGTRDAPYTLTEALVAVDGFPGQIIRMKAPLASPLRAQYTYDSAFALIIEGWDGEPWYAYGSDLHTSGWSAVGGGIYSKALGVSSIGTVLVSTLTQTVGDRSDWWYKLTLATVPATPAQGQYGFSAGTVYVRLPGDANPNSHSLEIARRNTSFWTYGLGRMTLRDVTARCAIISPLLVGLSTIADGAGNLTVEDSLIEYGGNAGGLSASGKFQSLIARTVRAYRSDNDGYNIHAPVPGGSACLAQLYGCEGSYNGDVINDSSQGASAHEACVMELHGGHYDHNVSGGMVSIDTSVNRLIGNGPDGPVYMENNMRLGNTGGTITAQAACAWMNSTTGTVTGPIYVRNNLGVGVRVATPAAVTGLGNIVSTGNGAADVIA